jgi:hypothetical protein
VQTSRDIHANPCNLTTMLISMTCIFYGAIWLALSSTETHHFKQSAINFAIDTPPSLQCT